MTQKKPEGSYSETAASPMDSDDGMFQERPDCGDRSGREVGGGGWGGDLAESRDLQGRQNTPRGTNRGDVLPCVRLRPRSLRPLKC